MSCELLSGNQTSFYLSPVSYQSSSKPKPLLPNSFISLSNIHLKKPVFSGKSSSGPYKSRTKAALNTLSPAHTTESFYELLGISESGTLPEIKKAYKQMARKYHPDMSPADRTEEFTQRFILVQEAYETLSDPLTRASYDRDLSTGFHLAFSARRKTAVYNQGSEEGEWKNRWQSQLNELKRKSMSNDSRGSWGARMRMQRSQ